MKENYDSIQTTNQFSKLKTFARWKTKRGVPAIDINYIGENPQRKCEEILYHLKERIIKKGDKILFLGCSYGHEVYSLAYLTQNSVSIIGYDIKSSVIKINLKSCLFEPDGAICNASYSFCIISSGTLFDL